MNIPFAYRVLTLLILMGLVAGIDRYRRGTESVRYREYGFILLSGVVGCSIGAINDLFTSGISPEYFIIGKGLGEENLRTEAVLLGLKSGFSAGVIGGAVCLFATGANRPAFRRICRMLMLPAACALVAGMLFPLALAKFDPRDLTGAAGDLLSTEQLARFRTVWWIHTGLYTGMAVGLLAMILRLRKGKTTFTPQAMEADRQ